MVRPDACIGSDNRIVATGRAYTATCLMQGADCENAKLQPDQQTEIIRLDYDIATFLRTEFEHSRLSARAYHKIQRGPPRTIANLNADVTISRPTIGEALAHQLMPLLA